MGANAGHAKRPMACSTPVRTTPMPYRGIWTANMRRKAATRSTWRPGSVPDEAGSSAAMGSARAARTSANGVRTARTTPSRPEAMRETSRLREGIATAASSGTTVAASAPPTTISYRALGTWLAVA